MVTDSTSQPLYYQILLNLREKIARGELAPGKKLPAEKELMDEYGVSRVTVRRALKELCALGITEHRGKRGHFVATLRDQTYKINPNRSLFDQTRAAGREASSKILSMSTIEASKNKAALFSIEKDAPLLEIVRLRYIDDVPFSTERLLLPPDLFEGINPWEMEHRSFIDIMMSDFGIDIAYSTQSLNPQIPSKQEAELLNLSTRHPLLMITSYTYDRSGRLVKLTEMLTNTDIMEYSFTWIGQ